MVEFSNTREFERFNDSENDADLRNGSSISAFWKHPNGSKLLKTCHYKTSRVYKWILTQCKALFHNTRGTCDKTERNDDYKYTICIYYYLILSKYTQHLMLAAYPCVTSVTSRLHFDLKLTFFFRKRAQNLLVYMFSFLLSNMYIQTALHLIFQRGLLQRDSNIPKPAYK